VPVEPLDRDIRADVLVIGAGVSGALVADRLSGEREVVIIDRRGLALGATAASTALVAHEIDTPLVELTRMIGADRAIRAWRRSRAAVRALAERTKALRIECGFAARSSLYLAGTVLDGEGLAAEAVARQAAGLEATLLSRQRLGDRFGIDRDAALLSDGDFLVDPRQLTAGYLRAALGRGARIHAPAEANNIAEAAGGLIVATKAGPTIAARQVVYCTGYELPTVLTGRGHRRVSTYALATIPQPRLHPALACLVTEASDPYLYLRDGPDCRIICGGEDEAVADADARDALLPAKIAVIRHKLARLLPGIDATPEFAWAGTFGDSETGLPSIGVVPGLANAMAVVGFGGNGMVYARIAAEIIAATLAGRIDPDADLFANL
jgi:glycine/D-amino acid oxidase-like deaminating enzyme